MTATTSIYSMRSSRMASILAATGSAVGLGNVWRFPCAAGIGYRAWRLPIRSVALLAVAVILVNAVGLLKRMGLG